MTGADAKADALTTEALLTVPPLDGDWELPGFAGFAAHNGPIWRDAGSGDLGMHVAHERTNTAGRLHGGMEMSLQALALTQAAQGARPQEGVQLLTLNCELLDSAGPGDWVTACARVERSTRTLVFVTGRIRSGDRVLMTASGVFAVTAPEADTRSELADAAPPGWSVQQPLTPFCAHVGALYERFDAAGERFGAVRVCRRHLRADGSDDIDSGMLLMLADLYLGRRARLSMGGPCVTLGMTLSQSAPIRLGDLVEIDSSFQGRAMDAGFVTGSLRIGGAQVGTLTSSWKKVNRK